MLALNALSPLAGLATAILIVSYLVGVVLHEAGHLAAARLLGLQVRRVSLGAGPALLRARLRGVTYIVRGIPASGYVAIALQPGTKQADYAAMVAAGPGVNAALLIAATAAYALMPDADWIILPFGAAQACILFIALTPFSLGRAGRPGHAGQASDGQQLNHLLRHRGLDLFGSRYAALAKLMGDAGRAPPGPSANAGELMYQLTRTDRLAEPWAAAEACASMRQLLGPWRLNPLERALALDYLASSALLLGGMGESEAELDRWSAEACTLAPGTATTITRGGVLAITGRAGEAAALLQPLLAGLTEPFDLFRCHLHLAQAAAAEGRHDAATAEMDAARQIAAGKLALRIFMLDILSRVQRWPPLAAEAALRGS